MAAVQGLIVAAGGLGFGYLIASRVLARRATPSTLRWALALPSLVGYALLLMVVHLATGGWVFSNEWFLRAFTAAVAFCLVVARLVAPPSTSPDRTATWVAFGLVAIGLILWGYPTLEEMPLHFSPDTRTHMGWAHQLLSGSPTPTAALSGDIPNFYPWLFHALAALVALFTPGGNPFHALVPMQFMFVGGLVLSLFALGRELGRTLVTPIAAALFGALTGGVGFIVARGPAIVQKPRSEELLAYLGDLLLLRSYNFAFSNLAPPFPRDLTFVLLPVFLLLMIRGVRGNSNGYLAAAGGVLGMIGLAQGGEAFLVGSVGAAACIALTYRDGILVRAAMVAAPMLTLYGIWAVPLAVNYFRHGGFFDMSSSSLDIPLWAAAASCGVIVPLGAYGIVRAIPRSRTDESMRVVLGFLVAAVATLLASSLSGALLGEGLAAISRRHRYWPIVCLALAILAAVGASDLWARLWRRRLRAVALLSALLVVLVALPSPMLASLAYPDEVRTRPVVGMAMAKGGPRTYLDELNTRTGVVCTVATPLRFADSIHAFTGHRDVAIVLGENLEGNEARVRWRDVYEETESLDTRIEDSKALTLGGGNPEHWDDLVAKYDVDVVVVPERAIERASFDDYPRAPVIHEDQTFFVVWVDDCRA